MQADEVSSLVTKAIEEAMKERGVLNILIAGRTGVGKTTLINAVFQGKMAETGQGRPVTQTTREITKEGVPLRIWDTRGLELAEYRKTLSELEKIVSERSQDSDPTRHIHVAWLCIQEDGRRVEDAEIELHETLSRYMPMLAVITKARADKGFRAKVQELLPKAKSVVRVHAEAELLDDGHSVPATGLEDLIDATSEIIPEAHRRAFAAAQKVSVEYKVRNAQKVVAGATAMAVAAGASPIPFSDAAILVPIQIGMLAGISATFGLELSRAFLSTLVSAAAGTVAATVAGRAIVANLIKLIPGGGSLVGGAISAATAGALTTTLGEIYIATLFFVFKGSDTTPSPKQIAEEFKRRLKERQAKS